MRPAIFKFMRTVRGTLGALGVLAGCCLCFAAPAPALEPGVHVDPGSPAGKEYSLPLGQARQTGGSGSSTGNEGNTLFGAGIKPPKGGTGGGKAAGGTGGGPAGGTGGATASSSTTPPAGVLRAARDHSSDASLLALIGGGVAILVLGAFGGTVLRHRRPPRPTQRPTQ
jgi:hypothetical protein